MKIDIQEIIKRIYFRFTDKKYYFFEPSCEEILGPFNSYSAALDAINILYYKE